MLTKIGQPRTPTEDLVDLLLECHERIRRFVGIACTIGARPEAPSGEVAEACRGVERYFTEALPLHVRDEDDSILPRLRGRSDEVDQALQAMHEQHEQHRPKLQSMLKACSAVRRAPEDPARRTELLTVANDLRDEFERHLQLEEATILPAIRHLLSADEQRTIVQELRRRRGQDEQARGSSKTAD